MPFMSEWRKRKIREEHEATARRRAASSPASPITDPANPASIYYQSNHFYPDGSYTSTSTGSDSGYASRSEPDYGSRDSGSSSSSYDSGSSSYDSGSSGGSYSE